MTITDDALVDPIIELYASREPATTKLYPQRFKEMFNEEFIPWLESELSENFKNYISSLAKGCRKEEKNPRRRENK